MTDTCSSSLLGLHKLINKIGLPCIRHLRIMKLPSLSVYSASIVQSRPYSDTNQNSSSIIFTM